MGGNALQTPSRRIPRAEYERLESDVLHRLYSYNHTLRHQAIPAYRQKPDFGDMDVLVAWAPGVDPRQAIAECFEPAEIVHNGGVYSIGIDGFQVDLIGCSPESDRFEAALNYYSWNDLGNLQGRIAHKLGFRYGHRGLLLPVRDRHGHVAGEVEVSLDTRTILRFLNYNASRFYEGFDTLEEIFQYAASTSFFDPAIFAFDHLNHINRVRNRKRASYMAFVEWVERTKPEAGRDLVGEMHREETMWRAYAYFDRTELDAKIAAVYDRIERKEAVRAKFNGDLVREIHPHLQGEALGRFIAEFKKAYGTEINPPRDEWFENWVLRVSPEEIRTAILMFGAEPAAAPAPSSPSTP